MDGELREARSLYGVGLSPSRLTGILIASSDNLIPLTIPIPSELPCSVSKVAPVIENGVRPELSVGSLFEGDAG
jgi:hypothetical protein